MPRTPRPRGRLTPEAQRLALEHLPLARWWAAPFKLRRPDASNDFESAACGALVEAAEAFDPSRGLRFATLAKRYVLGALCNTFRRFRPLGYRCSPEGMPLMEQLADDVDGHGCTAGTRGLEEAEESRDAVEAWLARLPPLHAELCRLIYLRGMDPREAADEMGFRPARAARIHREAMSILRGSIETRPAESSHARVASQGRPVDRGHAPLGRRPAYPGL